MEELEETISPARAWEIMMTNVVSFTDATIQNHLRTFAIALVKHRQLAAAHSQEAFNEDNALLHLVCTIHGARPEPGTILSIERFALAPCLTLAMWDSLYYALIAEVRSQYAAATMSTGDKILHEHGSTGDATNQPFTVDGFQVLLKNIWGFLVDPRLLGPLETAVRIHEVAETLRAGDIDHEFRQTFQQLWQGYSVREKEEILDKTEGMLDVARMSIAKIDSDLRHFCMGKVRRACLEELKIPFPRAEQEEREPTDDSSQWTHLGSSPPTEENPCCCTPNCVCRLRTSRDVQSEPGQSLSSPPATQAARARTNTTGSQQLYGVHQPPRRQQGKQVFPTEFYAEQRGSSRYPRFTPSSPEPSSSPHPSTKSLPSQQGQDLPQAPVEAPPARPSFNSRRLVSAGGDLPLSKREIFPDDHLPQPEERGWAMTKEQFEALPTPRRPSNVAAGEAGPAPRRPSWVKRVFSRSNSYSQ
ncbi:hypothetical protein Slin15195_G007360 [Septoria linicola]|uniref:Uncharacterized protein n=1 Tax=Septoria linicola TaxID=215465 RepID=A0A9Q9EF96_9PEZI|nr:hypothetical protein Slin14017_G007370 [Septoria linicola]USW47417.1 hypothetical protein Slin15195_G007360 [Septoria linicola]